MSSGLGPPSLSQRSFRRRRRSSWAFCWLRVTFFFFFTSGLLPESSAPLPAGVPAAEAAGLCRRERDGVFVALPFLTSRMSSTTDVFPCRTTRPLSTFQISGPEVKDEHQCPRRKRGLHT